MILLMYSFKTEFERKYVDEKEEAVRTNLFVQNRRFISSANRLDAPFKCGVNFLADRLDGELEQLLGVQYDSDEGNIHPDPFPYAEQGRSELGAKLPREFDWRKRGGVTPVRCAYRPACHKLLNPYAPLNAACVHRPRIVLFVLGLRCNGRCGRSAFCAHTPSCVAL